MSSSRASSSSLKKHDQLPSITPQRKHRKLLKDGSGTEVWPESIEKVFVQGLREYWESPYATYSQSRGRSRWRNQFLVDYLTKHGIDRSKKQVASHIQVLRNMWKEFALVAGGDELYPDSGSPLPVKLEEHYDTNALIPFDWEEGDLPSSNPVSPDFSPADSQSEFPPTPEHRPNLFPSDFGAIHPKVHGLPLDLSYSAPGMTSPSISPHGSYIQQLPGYDGSPFSLPQSKHSSVSPVQAPYQAPRKQPAEAQSVNRHQNATPTHHRSTRNKVTGIFLQADGMTPFSVKVDALVHPTAQIQPPFTLRVRMALESVWSATGRCVTKTYGNNVCLAEESGFLNITHINVGTVNVVLPESPLSRCRGFDPSYSIVLTQEIIVDDETLLFVIYDLDRRTGGPMPSAALLGYQKYRAADKSTPQPSTLSPSPSAPISPPHATPYSRPATQPPLSYNLTPMRYPASTGPHF
ncbi:hypothetical protein NLJ89_g11790 [Agrocybe chaxingu]|uniref:TEA domain-containing protein n=1 Tax=Agrocybe chaxingu TaxID=84603 RepID=A0A9W8JVN7_9AGAR|nr:hypothetical protein NLJ89_g11790 [Agrocybe chaxingu]